MIYVPKLKNSQHSIFKNKKSYTYQNDDFLSLTFFLNFTCLHFGDLGSKRPKSLMFSKCGDFCQLAPKKKLESSVKILLKKSNTKEQGHQIIPRPPAK